MINDLDKLQDRMYTISNEAADTAIYENRMIQGLMSVYIINEGLGEDPFSIYDIKEAKIAYSNFKNWAHTEISNMISALNETRKKFIENGDYDDEEQAEDLAADVVKDAIMSWTTASGIETTSIGNALKQCSFRLIGGYSELAEQLNEFDDFSDWDRAFEDHIDEFPKRIVDEVFDDEVHR